MVQSALSSRSACIIHGIYDTPHVGIILGMYGDQNWGSSISVGWIVYMTRPARCEGSWHVYTHTDVHISDPGLHGETMAQNMGSLLWATMKLTHWEGLAPICVRTHQLLPAIPGQPLTGEEKYRHTTCWNHELNCIYRYVLLPQEVKCHCCIFIQ